MARLTDRAREVLSLASAEAIEFRHSYVGTEHILLGLVREGSGVAAKVLGGLGIDPDAVRAEVEKLVAPGIEQLGAKELSMTPKANGVIQMAGEQAEMLGHDYVGTEHLLLGLLSEEEGVAAQVLGQLGVGLEQVVDVIGKLLPPTDSKPNQEKDIGLPDLPQLTTESEDAAETSATGDERLCLDGLAEVQDLKTLARLAGQITRQKEEAIAAEDFERAALLRDAIAELRKIVGEAKEKWPGIPPEKA